jgi:hypothetical protein
MTKPMPIADLEQIYETLAVGIDRAGPEREALFLARLVLLLAERLGSASAFSACVEAAIEELPAAPQPS